MSAHERIAYAGNENEELIAKGDISWVLRGVAGTEDAVKGTATNDAFTFIAVAVGLLISISPLLMSMLF
jgi:hypothetical protein